MGKVVMKLSRHTVTGKRLRLILVLVVLAAAAPSLPAGDEPGAAVRKRADEIKKHIAADYDRLEALYKHLHANPEVSLKEEQTSARMAKELREAGFEVSEKVGGHGVVGVLKNGDGP